MKGDIMVMRKYNLYYDEPTKLAEMLSFFQKEEEGCPFLVFINLEKHRICVEPLLDSQTAISRIVEERSNEKNNFDRQWISGSVDGKNDTRKFELLGNKEHISSEKESELCKKLQTAFDHFDKLKQKIRSSKSESISDPMIVTSLKTSNTMDTDEEEISPGPKKA